MDQMIARMCAAAANHASLVRHIPVLQVYVSVVRRSSADVLCVIVVIEWRALTVRSQNAIEAVNFSRVDDGANLGRVQVITTTTRATDIIERQLNDLEAVVADDALRIDRRTIENER